MRLVALCPLFPTGLPRGAPQRKRTPNCASSSQGRREQESSSQHDVAGCQNHAYGLAALWPLPHLLWNIGSLQLAVVVYPVHHCRSRIQRSPGSVDECATLCGSLWLVCAYLRGEHLTDGITYSHTNCWFVVSGPLQCPRYSQRRVLAPRCRRVYSHGHATSRCLPAQIRLSHPCIGGILCLCPTNAGMALVKCLQYRFRRSSHCNQCECRGWNWPNPRGVDIPKGGGRSGISHWSLDQCGDASHGFGGSSWTPSLVWLQESEASSRKLRTGSPVIPTLRRESGIRWRLTDVFTIDKVYISASCSGCLFFCSSSLLCSV